MHWHQFIQAEKSVVSIKSSSNGITFPLSLFTNVFNLIRMRQTHRRLRTVEFYVGEGGGEGGKGGDNFSWVGIVFSIWKSGWFTMGATMY